MEDARRPTPDLRSETHALRRLGGKGDRCPLVNVAGVSEIGGGVERGFHRGPEDTYMTRQQHLKERIRARMSKTGESYTAARRRVLASRRDTDSSAPTYRLRGGIHPDTSAFANSLANARVVCNGKPLSEPLILGIGGGLGAGYILWQFTGHHPIVTLGFRNQWQYPDKWLIKTALRLGIEPKVHETSGHLTAMRSLRDALASSGPRPLVWIDAQEIGYWHLPERLSGHGGYPVVIYDEIDGRFLIDDRNSAQLSVDEATLRAARGRVSSYRNRLVTFEAPDEIPDRVLARAIEEGLKDHVSHLESDSDSFSLPAWRKWSRMLMDTRQKKGWANAFSDQAGLFGVLLSIYESIESSGYGGGSLRGVYANFLEAAAELTSRPALATVAGGYRDLDRQWAVLAERAAPNDPGLFTHARKLIDSLHEQVLDGGDRSEPAARRIANELWRLRDTGDEVNVLDENAFIQLLESLGSAIQTLYEGEQSVLSDLASAVNGTSITRSRRRSK